MKSLLDSAYMGAIRELKKDKESFKAFEGSALAIHTKAERVLTSASETLKEHNFKVLSIDMEIELSGNYELLVVCDGNGIFREMSEPLAKRLTADFEARVEDKSPLRISCKLEPYAHQVDCNSWGQEIYNSHIFIKG